MVRELSLNKALKKKTLREKKKTSNSIIQKQCTSGKLPEIVSVQVLFLL